MSALDCKDVDERLLDYLYEELSPAESEAMAAHLASCAKCRAEFDSMKRVRQAASSLPMAEPSPSVTERLLQAAQEQASLAMAGAGAGAGSHLRVVSSQASAAAPLHGNGAGEANGKVSHATAGARRRTATRFSRFFYSPAFAAAAMFLVVGVGSAYFLTAKRDQVLGPVPASAPPATGVAARPAETPGAAAGEPGVAAVAAGEAASAAEREKADPDDPIFPGARAGRPAAPVPVAKAAPRRDPSGHGVWLAKGENDVLADSVEKAPPPTGERAMGMVAPAPIEAPAAPAAAAPPPPAPAQNVVEAKKKDRTSQGAPLSNTAQAEDEAGGLRAANAPRPAATPEGSAGGPVAGQAPARPGAGRGDATVDAFPTDQAVSPAARKELTDKLAQMRGAAVMQNDCHLAIERYGEIRQMAPGYKPSATERWNIARCYEKVNRFDDARGELAALQREQPGYKEQVARELDAIRKKEQVAQRQQQQQQPATPAQTPSVHGAQKRGAKKAADSAPAAAAPAME